MTLDQRFPTLTDLREKAKGRIPRYLWDYLEGGTGNEAAVDANTEALRETRLLPDVLAPKPEPDLSTSLLGTTYACPFGIAPVGMSGAVWPQAELKLARHASAAGIPYAMSTVAAATPEEVAPETKGRAWFQLYAPSDPEMRRDILARVRDAGFSTLILTIDVPVLSRRPRELRHRLENPMRLTPRVLFQSAICPVWARGMLGRPTPRPRIFDKYTRHHPLDTQSKHIGLALRAAPDWAYLEALRSEWDGPLIAKGVLDPAQVAPLLQGGVDAIWVSNHGGRQFEAAPTALHQLSAIREAAGPETPLISDGAITSGTDVLRHLALGADFVMLGRGYHWGLGAADEAGAAHVTHILSEEMKIDMAQLAIHRPHQARDRLVTR